MNPGDRVIYNAESIVTFVRHQADGTHTIIEMGGTTILVPRVLVSPLVT